MAENAVFERCRLVVLLPERFVRLFSGETLDAVLNGGDVASIIVPPYDLDETDYQSVLSAVVEVTSGMDIAVLGVDDTRVVGRAGADGLMITGSQPVLDEAMAKHGGKMIVGCGHITTRHDALRRAEAEPDFVFFGRIGKDVHPVPHAKNLEIATWWAQMVETPCIVMGGNDVETIGDAAQTGADFVALSEAIFAGEMDPAASVARANQLLEPYVLPVA